MHPSWVNFFHHRKRFDDGKIIALSESLPDGGEQGWWIPKYIADKNPDLKTFDDLLKHPDLFPDPENPSKGAIYNGAPGWGGTVVTSQFYKAFEFEKAGFKNAIYALEAPNDASWSIDDARHSAIVYKPSNIPNASGPSKPLSKGIKR